MTHGKKIPRARNMFQDLPQDHSIELSTKFGGLVISRRVKAYERAGTELVPLTSILNALRIGIRSQDAVSLLS
jgi:hypothetical protein